MRKAHKIGCRHCLMVDEYRQAVELERDASGGWRNETFRASFTFADWLTRWHREQRISAGRN